jgi:hypothetical protein
MKVRINLKVNNANDRDKDCIYIMDVDLQVFPGIGSSLVFQNDKNEQRTFEVASFTQIINNGKQDYYPDVILRPDQQTFKGVKFESICEKLERLGFRLV